MVFGYELYVVIVKRRVGIKEGDARKCQQVGGWFCQAIRLNYKYL